MPSSPANYQTVLVRAAQKATGSELTVTSESFDEGGMIGLEYVHTSAGGMNRSPQLSWSGAPKETRGFAITCFDPDAPTGSGYWHWLTWGIPTGITRLDAGAGSSAPPAGGRGGYSDDGMPTYGGPSPPKGDGAHRYVFTVYALDVPTLEGASEKTTGASMIFRMRGHVLASGTITGRFGH
jgi:hypothetical protein